MAISKITTENFTVFNKIEMDFSNGINVFIGENGTGKTHILKIIYWACESEREEQEALRESNDDIQYLGNIKARRRPPQKLIQCFYPCKSESLMRIKSATRRINFTPDDKQKNDDFESCDQSTNNEWKAGSKGTIPAIFIPAKEMLTHAGIEKDFMQRNLPFDITLIDILYKAGVSTIKNLPEEKLVILDKIASIIGGKVLCMNDRYYTEKPDGTLIDFAAEAEGFKKLGLIYRLIETGHLEKDSVLIWDEPEANLNPKLIPELVDIILTLEQMGVQMFFATHDYFFAKFLEVRKKRDNKVIYHALNKEGDEVTCESQSDFSLLENNSILRQFIDLYKEEVMKVME